MIVSKSSYEEIKNDILNCCQNICESMEMESFSSHIESKLNDFRPTLMIYGAYNAGKSTLLNALFGKEEFAKTGDAPETKEVHEYEYNGYTIFDTPGLNARGEDDIVTAEHLNKSEVVLFVISNNGSLEEEFVYNKISEVVKVNKPIIIVLNNKSGIDLNSQESTEILDKVSKNLIKIGDRNNIHKIETKVQVCMVNAKSALKSKIENKSIMLKKSNILILEEMIETCLISSGQKEVINALNIYIKNFIDNIIIKIDSKIDIIQLKKLEELITYLEKLKQNSEVKSKNIVDKKMIAVVDEISSMMCNKDITENSLNHYIEQSILEVNEQITQLVNSINSNISTKIGEFSKEFEQLIVNSIEFDTPEDELNDLNTSKIPDEIKDKLKGLIADKRVLEEASKQVLKLAKGYLPKLMKGKGPVWIGKAAGKVAIGISVAIEGYNIYNAQKEYNERSEKERERVIGIKNRAKSIADELEKSLYGSIDELIDEIFNDLISGFRDTSAQIGKDNSQLLNAKSHLISILNKL